MKRFAVGYFVEVAAVFSLLFASACSDCENSADCPLGRVCMDGECVSVDEESDGGCGDTFVASESVLDFGEVSPSSGPISKQLVFENKGGSTVYVVSFDVTTEDDSCGEFSIAGDKGAKEVASDGRFETTITFTPNAGADPGCPCHAVGFFGIHLQSRTVCEMDDVSLMAAGPCDKPLRCNLDEVVFEGAIIESSYEKVLTCYSFDLSGSKVEKVALAENSSPAFSIFGLKSDLPIQLAQGESISFAVQYLPVEPGDDKGEARIALSNGVEMAIPLSGTADRERPLCESGLPSQPDPVLEVDNYVIALESNDLSFYSGIVRSQWFYDDMPPLISDILVTSGSFSDTDCEVGQSGHQYQWVNCDPSGGTITNIHAVPSSENVEEWVFSLEVWDEVTVVGYEVDRIDYDNGSWWTDAGCNTMIITWICDGELNARW